MGTCLDVFVTTWEFWVFILLVFWLIEVCARNAHYLLAVTHYEHTRYLVKSFMDHWPVHLLKLIRHKELLLKEKNALARFLWHKNQIEGSVSEVIISFPTKMHTGSRGNAS